MSCHNPATCETVPLLGDPRPADQSSRTLSRVPFGFSPEVLFIPVAIATKLATLIPSTTLIELVRQAACRFWNTLPPDGSIPPELCDAPEVERLFATAVAVLGAAEGVFMMAGCSLASRISSHYGRKPTFLLAFSTGLVGNCLIAVSQYMPSWLIDYVFIGGILLGLLAGSCLYSYLVGVYVVDVSVPEDRTAALSRVAGWAALGTCISYGLGGTITTKTGNPLIVFYVSAAILFVTCAYAAFVLPESFPEEKRNALSLLRRETPSKGFFTRPLLIFEPLKMLAPTKKVDGTRNWRLFWCAAHNLVFGIANNYATSAWLVLVTSKYHLTPADTGLFLTTTSFSSVIILALIVPPVVRFLRPCYTRRIVGSLVEEGTCNGQELRSGNSDRLDVHLAVMTSVVAGVFYLSAAASTTAQTLILSAIFIGFTYVHTPTLRSLVAGTVDPLTQGEALAALDMISGVGCALSPIIMGSILTATINTMPLFVFYVHLTAVLISSVPLLLVRDADRYQKPHEA